MKISYYSYLIGTYQCHYYYRK